MQVFQSRIFTQQGGNIELFSVNGDLNADKGPKSSAAYPPLRLICDADGYCRVNPAGLITGAGAGVGALLSVPGQDPTKSNVVLTAPHGTVDAGAAGIRVAGSLNIVALQVLNAFNVDVGGVTVGIPTTAAPNIGALTNTAAAAAASQGATAPQASANAQPSIIIVEVIGFGGGDGGSAPGEEGRREGSPAEQQGSYDASSIFRGRQRSADRRSERTAYQRETGQTQDSVTDLILRTSETGTEGRSPLLRKPVVVASAGRLIGRTSSDGIVTQMRADLGEIDEPINGSHPMIGWDVALQAELKKQRLLRQPPVAHRYAALCPRATRAAMRTSSTVSARPDRTGRSSGRRRAWVKFKAHFPHPRRFQGMCRETVILKP